MHNMGSKYVHTARLQDIQLPPEHWDTARHTSCVRKVLVYNHMRAKPQQQAFLRTTCTYSMHAAKERFLVDTIVPAVTF